MEGPEGRELRREAGPRAQGKEVDPRKWMPPPSPVWLTQLARLLSHQVLRKP